MLILSRISPVTVIDDSSSLPPAAPRLLPPSSMWDTIRNRSRPKIIVIDSHTSRFRYASYVSESLVAVAATRGMIPLAKPGSLLGSLTMLWRINVITRYAATPLLARESAGSARARQTSVLPGHPPCNLHLVFRFYLGARFR